MNCQLFFRKKIIFSKPVQGFKGSGAKNINKNNALQAVERLV